MFDVSSYIWFQIVCAGRKKKNPFGFAAGLPEGMIRNGDKA